VALVLNHTNQLFIGSYKLTAQMFTPPYFHLILTLLSKSLTVLKCTCIKLSWGLQRKFPFAKSYIASIKKHQSAIWVPSICHRTLAGVLQWALEAASGTSNRHTNRERKPWSRLSCYSCMHIKTKGGRRDAIGMKAATRHGIHTLESSNRNNTVLAYHGTDRERERVNKYY
jgi:hypothetical protein